jgi:ribosome-associated toxin RatA of RatAB toxin-antitoxin module
MAEYTFNKVLHYPLELIFNIIKDVDCYHEFLPGIAFSETYDHAESHFTGKLTIAYKAIKQTYQSRVIFKQDAHCAYVRSTAIDGPFHYLKSYWDLNSVGDDKNLCEVNLTLSFDFNSIIIKQLLTPYLEKGAHSMIDAFEQRAHDLTQKVQ